MAVFLNNKVGVKVNSVDLSSYVSSVSLNRSFNELDVTAMGDKGVRQVKGLEQSSVSISFFNDTATSKVLQTLQAAWGTSVNVVLIQDKAGTVGADNPLYTASCLINNTTDINGAVSDLGTIDVQWNVNGEVTVATTGTF
jgi:hypothetical protein